MLAAQLRRRQHAAARLPPLACGCRDPLTCFCYGDPLAEALNRQAVSEPLSLMDSLSTLRRLWVRADNADRRMVGRIARALIESAEAAS
jgi:hypothetical protein